MTCSSITQEMLHEFFYYKDGVLYWKISKPRSRKKAHDAAGRRVKQGYLQTCINRKRVLNHQIIFMMFHGYIPKEIDHIDRNVDNNRIENCPIIDGVGFITNNPMYSPFKNTPNFNTVSNCNLTFAVHFQQCEYNRIENCDINLEFIKEGIVNFISFSRSNNNTISNCTIYNNSGNPPFYKGVGCSLSWNSFIGDPYSHYNNIINNTFYNFSDNAVELLYNADYNNIIRNRFINSSTGVYIASYENKNEYNRIYHNTFLNNSKNAYDAGNNYWNDSYPSGGNYWDDYKWFDKYRGPNQNILGSDGIGDTPYDISGDGNNKDWYPLMYLWGENPPIADLSFIVDNFTVFFDASSSIDRDGTIISYEWDFGDGTVGEGLIINHTYSEESNYIVELTVTDDDGKQDSWPWSFRIPNYAPYAPSAPSPEDGATGVDIDTTLSWSCSDPEYQQLTYDVYFDTNSPPSKVSSNQSDMIYDPGILDFETTYYWKIVAWDEYGLSTSGPVWNFTTRVNLPPYEPSDPDPKNESNDISINTNLYWTGGDPDENDTVYYNVFFEADNPDPKKVANDISQTWFDPGELEYNTTYYWKIVARDNNYAVNESAVWHFTTVMNLPPNPPSIEGPTNGKHGEYNSYMISAIDPENHNVFFYIDWGDETNSGWIGPYLSGMERNFTHAWKEQGTYLIKVKAKDVYDAESNWSVFKVTIPRTRATTYLWYHWFLECFPLLERLLNLMR